jgi:hypothetical protein
MSAVTDKIDYAQQAREALCAIERSEAELEAGWRSICEGNDNLTDEDIRNAGKDPAVFRQGVRDALCNSRWRICNGCQRSFEFTRNDALYCSNACRQKAYRQRELRARP